jgi:hypothetical protein
MAEYTLTTPTAVAVGSAVPYNNTVIGGCCNIRHRAGSGTIKVKGSGCCKCPRRYKVTFSANVTGVTGTITLGLYLDGELLPETEMNVIADAPANILTVNTATEILADCDCQTITARNIAGTGLTVNTASIIVERKA